ncbi:MAG: hypothetical protein KDK71_10435 [Chlamydiia bacterium]|nr:hypothetical protein [Chlamydiia bacterium]
MSDPTINLSYEVAKLGATYHDMSSERYKELDEEISRLQNLLSGTVLDLKTNLSNVKAKNPNDTTFDISEHWELIKDFEDYYHQTREELDKAKEKENVEANGETKPKNYRMFGKEEHEKSKSVSKADLETLIERLTNSSDNISHQVKRQTDQLLVQANLDMAVYDALNRTLRSSVQSQNNQIQANQKSR